MPGRSVLVLVGLALASGAGFAPLPRSFAQTVDRATEAMRREVEAARKREDAMWEKIRAVPAPPQENFVFQFFGDVEAVRFPVALGEGNRGQNAAQQVQIVMSDDQLCMGIFGNARNDTDRRGRLNRLLLVRIDDLNRRHSMTEAERKTLQLAGQGDIKRFFDHVTELRAQYGSALAIQMEMREFQALLEQVRGLKQDFQAGPFGDQSLFLKALNTIRSGGVASRH
jgi:hypothetical protein